MRYSYRTWITLIGLILLLAACSQTPTPTLAPTAAAVVVEPSATTIPTFTPMPTATPEPPTPTPEPPAAARVNGQLITLDSFERELARYEAAQEALGRNPADAGSLYQVQVLDAMIEQVLIEQAAATAGVAVSDEALAAETARLIEATGGQASYAEWLVLNQYSEDEFKQVLRSQMITQTMNERVAGEVADTAEEVHARHIVVDSAETAQEVLAQLEGGTDFATLAAAYSLDESTRQNGGDLGFFPRGLLLAPEVEEAAFGLSAGEVSGIIESAFGFHIVQVLEKDPARPLTPDLQQRLRVAAFERWVGQLWQEAVVEREI